MALLKEKKIMWAKLGKPEESFDKTYTQWSVVVLIDEVMSSKMKKAGLTGAGKTTIVGEKEVPSIRMSRKTHWKKSGDEKTPVKVVDMYGQDIDPRTVGNGTVANIQYTATPYEFNGKIGKSVELIAIQVIDLVEYKSTGVDSAGDEFSFLARETASLEDAGDDLDLGSDDIFE